MGDQIGFPKKSRKEHTNASPDHVRKSCYTKVDVVPLLRPEAAARLADRTLLHFLHQKDEVNLSPNYKVFQKHYNRNSCGISTPDPSAGFAKINQPFQHESKPFVTAKYDSFDGAKKRLRKGLPTPDATANLSSPLSNHVLNDRESSEGVFYDVQKSPAMSGPQSNRVGIIRKYEEMDLL